jgi:ribonuclease HI
MRAMPWKTFQFRDQIVYVRVLADGKPIVRKSLVEVRYRLGTTKSYKTARENLVEIEGDLIPDAEMGGVSTTLDAGGQINLKETPSTPPDENTIVIYTDGACSGNPGPAGVGVFYEDRERTAEISEFIESGTNNLAELTAILRGLEEIPVDAKDRRIHLYTDSAWSLGVLIGGWKAKTNMKLIESIKAKIEELPHLEMLKVRAHAGNSGNETADHLATKAIRREDNTRTERAKAR